ncbi:MAG: HEPN domain-containing protein [Christensenellales bacterium]
MTKIEVPYRGSGKVYFDEKEYQCDLYYNEEQGGIRILLNVKNEKSLGNFLQVPLELPHLCGRLENGFMFTLLRLKRIKTEGLVSYRMTRFTYNAEYILCGVISEGNHEQTFHTVEFVLSNIVEWGEESVYKIGERSELTKKCDEVKKVIYTGRGVCINYLVRGSILPITNYDLLKEHIEIRQYGIIEISFEKEEKFGEFIEIFRKLKGLIEIASLRKANVEKVFAYSEEVVYDMSYNELEHPVEVYGIDIQENNNGIHSQSSRRKWISLSELIAQNSFECYFEKHSELAPIIELYLEPFYVEFSSETRIFLNIVQALETYHSRFITNDTDEFRERVENLAKAFPPKRGEDIRKLLMAKNKKFITLESRIFDLLIANGQYRFDTGEIQLEEFPSVIAYTRNYYIHYDERIRKSRRVLKEEELKFYNRSLFQILDYYILLELGFSDLFELKRKLDERWGNISQQLSMLKLSRFRNNPQT